MVLSPFFAINESPVYPHSGCRCESYAILLLTMDGGGQAPRILPQPLQRHKDVHGFLERMHVHRLVQHAFPLKSAFRPQVHLVVLAVGLACITSSLYGTA